MCLYMFVFVYVCVCVCVCVCVYMFVCERTLICTNCFIHLSDFTSRISLNFRFEINFALNGYYLLHSIEIAGSEIGTSLRNYLKCLL